MNRTAISAVVAAIVIAALAFFLRREPPPSADAARNDQSTPQRNEPIQTERPRNPAATTPSDAPPRNQSANAAAPLPQAAPDAPITEALEQLSLPGVPQILETERAFAAQAVDAVWSQEAEANILDEIAQMTGLKLVTLRAECKRTLCRLQVSMQEVSGKNPFPQLASHVGLKPLWIIAANRNGVPTSVAYFERESSAPK